MTINFQSKDDFQAMFREYYGALCNYAVKVVADRGLAEDIVQGVFVKLWEQRRSVDITGSIKSYLFNSVRNAALDHFRSEKRKQRYLEQSFETQFEPAPSDEDMNAEIFRYKLLREIGQLKPKTQQIFVLHKIEGLTYEEISDHLDVPKRTVEYNIYTALAQLKEKLKADYEKYIAA